MIHKDEQTKRCQTFDSTIDKKPLGGSWNIGVTNGYKIRIQIYNMIKATILTINLFILSFLVLSINPSVWADSINPGVFSIDSKPYGLTYDQWDARYWQWSVSLPKDENPLDDKTGEKCASGQSGPVWFLTGTSGGTVKRSCTIPSDKAVLIHVAGNSCSYIENPNAKTESELRTCAINGNQVSSIKVTIDGTELKDVRKYHITSHLYSENITKDDYWGIEGYGPTQAVSDSYLLLLEPMSPGNHIITFSQSTLPINPTTSVSYTYDITYLMHIVSPSGS